MIVWIQKFMAFFSPVPGWEERLRAFQDGKTSWEVPGKAECNNTVPWPVEWIPHRLYGPEEELTQEESKRGFEMLEIRCVDTGLQAEIGHGACCARCGVNIHPKANKTRGFQPPACRRCAFFISRV